MKWISVEESLPEIPEGKYGVSVIVAEFDSIFEEINPGRGYSVHDSTYGYTRDGNGNKFPMYEGSEIEEDFLDLYIGGVKTEWGSTGDVVTHWMPLPEPPK